MKARRPTFARSGFRRDGRGGRIPSMRPPAIAVCILSAWLVCAPGSRPGTRSVARAEAPATPDANSATSRDAGDPAEADADDPAARRADASSDRDAGDASPPPAFDANRRLANLSAETIPLSPNEKIVLGDVTDRTPGFREAGFYVLLRAVARLEGLSRRQVEALEEPSYLKLMGHPELYRGQPIAMTLDVAYVVRLEPGPGRQFERVPGWPAGRPIWQLGCGHADSNRPVSVFSLADPTELLGEPLPVEGRDDVRVYEPVRRVKVAGVFFKVYRTETADGLHTGLFPALIAWQLIAPEVPAPARGPGVEMLLPLLLVAMVVSYYLIRRRITSASRGQRAGPRYVSRRHDEGAAGPGREDESR